MAARSVRLIYLLNKCLLHASHQPNACSGLWEQCEKNKKDTVPALWHLTFSSRTDSGQAYGGGAERRGTGSGGASGAR